MYVINTVLMIAEKYNGPRASDSTQILGPGHFFIYYRYDIFNYRNRDFYSLVSLGIFFVARGACGLYGDLFDGRL